MYSGMVLGGKDGTLLSAKDETSRVLGLYGFGPLSDFMEKRGHAAALLSLEKRHDGTAMDGAKIDDATYDRERTEKLQDIARDLARKDI
jgi:hypothetical protein